MHQYQIKMLVSPVSSVQKGENQDENMTQIEVQIESGPQSLRKIECTHCKNYIYV